MKNTVLIIGCLAIGFAGAYSVADAILKDKEVRLVVSVFVGCAGFAAALYYLLHPI